MLEMIRETWRLRHFWFELARHDIKERYRRSLLGIAWSLIKPGAMTFILTMIFSNVFAISVQEYAPYLFLGLVTWQFFAESILQGCTSFGLGRTYLRVRKIPLAIFPLRVVLSAGIHALIALTSAIAALGLIRGHLDLLPLLALAPALLIMVMAAWSLACLGALLHAVYSDTRQVAEIALQVLFYATPVIYIPASLTSTGWLRLLVECNPFSAFLELIRMPLLHGAWPTPHAILTAAVFATAISMIAWLALYRAERRLVLWL